MIFNLYNFHILVDVLTQVILQRNLNMEFM